MKIEFSSYSGKDVKIGVVDSGILFDNLEVCSNGLCGIDLTKESAEKSTEPNIFLDKIGHGTACTGIIWKKAPDAKIYSIKVFNIELKTDLQTINRAIEWGIENKLNILNLSLGSTYLRNEAVLYNVCKRAFENNIIIVAAASNNGTHSYPACYPFVFGVDAGKIQSKYGYFYRKGNTIELVARGDLQRLSWTEPKYIFMGGSSFAAPHITGIVALILQAYPDAGFEEVKEILIANALPGTPELVDSKKLYQVNGKSVSLSTPIITANEVDNERKSSKNLEWIRKAVIYPYNKEMHSLIRYQDLLPFEIVGVVDEVARLSIGKDAGEAFGTKNSGMTIVPASKLDTELEKADTLILGYLDEVGRIKKRDILETISLKAVTMGKNIYSLSSIQKDKYPEIWQIAQEKGLKICYPKVDMDSYTAVTNNSANHNEKIITPIVGVFGTGPQQGKFTSQLAFAAKTANQRLQSGADRHRTSIRAFWL